MNPYLIIGLSAAWLFSLFAVGSWQRADGAQNERLQWVERENREIADANEKIMRMQLDARMRERLHSLRLNEISTEHLKELKNVQTQRDRDVAAARNGSLVLRLSPTGFKASPDPAGAAAAASGRCDGEARSELPREIAADLLALAYDADAVVHQLSACQAVVASDREGQAP